MVTTQTMIRQTGFTVGSTQVTFGILWPDGGVLMNDWGRESLVSELSGARLTVYQFRGFKSRRVTYRVFFETINEFQALDLLVQQAGSLRVYHAGHTVPVDADDQHAIHGKMYASIACRLWSLTSLGIDGEGGVEAEATFLVTS